MSFHKISLLFFFFFVVDFFDGFLLDLLEGSGAEHDLASFSWGGIGDGGLTSSWRAGVSSSCSS